MARLTKRQKEEIIQQTLHRISPAVAGSAPGPVVGVASVNGRTGNVTLVGGDQPVFLPSGPSHAPGAVPDPGAVAGTSKFLREDATWQTVTASTPEVLQTTCAPVNDVDILANYAAWADEEFVVADGKELILETGGSLVIL